MPLMKQKCEKMSLVELVIFLSQSFYHISLQNLIELGQFCILTENLLPRRILDTMRVDMKKTVCVHDMCNPELCGFEKLPNHFEVVEKYLKKMEVSYQDEQCRI